ncbi:unnamed protein product, partial [Rotaria sp. Silwood2]
CFIFLMHRDFIASNIFIHLNNHIRNKDIGLVRVPEQETNASTTG